MDELLSGFEYVLTTCRDTAIEKLRGVDEYEVLDGECDHMWYSVKCFNEWREQFIKELSA